MLRLTVKKAPPDEVPEGAFFTITPGGATIGRTDVNSWRLTDSNSHVSRTHFKISLEQGEYYLTDTSTNGTYIDDQAEPLGEGNRVVLRAGSTIRLGEYVLEASLETQSAEPDPALSSAPAFMRQDDPALAPDPKPSNESPSFGATPAHMEPPDPAADHWPQDISAQPLPDNPFGQTAAEPTGLIQGNPSGFPAQTLPADWNTDPAPQTPPTTQAPATQVTPVSYAEQQGALVSQTANPAEPTPVQTQVQPPTRQSDTSVIPDNWYEDPKASGIGATAGAPETPPEPTAPTAAPAQPVSEPTAAPPSPPVAPPEVKAQSAATAQNGETTVEPLRGIMAKVLGGNANNMGQAELLSAVEEMAAILAMIVPTLMDSMRARSQFKDQLRLHQTMIQAEDNNPLKFVGNAEKVLEHILLNDQPGLLQGRHAMREAMEELAAHQGAMIAALGPALQEAMRQLSPEAIEGLAGSPTLAGFNPRVKSKLWDTYVSTYAKLGEAGRDSLEQRFMRSLAESYEQILRNK